MDVFAVVHERVAAILSAMVAEGRLPQMLDLSRLMVEPPRDTRHGDIVINAALVYADVAEAHVLSRRQLAIEIAAALAADPAIDQAEVSGSGFINVRLRRETYSAILRAALVDPVAYAGGGRPIAAIATRSNGEEEDRRVCSLFTRSDVAVVSESAMARDQSKDNPVFWVQYAYARACSTRRRASLAFPDLDISPRRLADADLGRLVDPGETSLIRLIAQFPRVMSAATRLHDPRRLASFLYEIAASFHAHWTKSKDQPQLRFVNEESREMTCVRLALVSAIGDVVSTGLGVLDVSAPDEMR